VPVTSSAGDSAAHLRPRRAGPGACRGRRQAGRVHANAPGGGPTYRRRPGGFRPLWGRTEFAL